MATIILILLNIIVFIALKATATDPSVAAAIVGSAGMPPAAGDYTAWSMLSHFFLHLDSAHLAFNMLWLLAFGLLLEKASGWKVLLACYLSGGIAGGIAYAVFPYGTPQPVLVGASAATLSVAAAAVLSGAVSHSPFPQALKVFIFALAIIAATNFLYLSFAHINASLPSHIAGIAVGITAGTAIKSRHNALKREQIATAGLLKELNTLVSKANTRGFESLSEAERLRLFQISGLDKLNFHNKKLPECHTP